MPKDTQPIQVDADGRETHPAFGWASLHKVSSTPGASLFDSEIRHPSYVTLTLTAATRQRDLNHDWIHGGSKTKVEIAFSEAQWGAFLSSFNQSGVPCTILYDQTVEDWNVPNIPFEPRLGLSMDETRRAGEKAYAKVVKALEAVEEKPTKANVRALRVALENSGPNIEYAAKTLTEHVENVVTKAKYDIEGMVTRHAEHLGLSGADVPTLALTSGEPEEDTEVEAT